MRNLLLRGAALLLLPAAACALAQPGARLSATEEIYRLAILQLTGADASAAANAGPTLCLAVGGGSDQARDPSPRLLAAVRERIPTAVAASQCPRPPAESRVRPDGPTWLALGAIRRDANGVSSFGWDFTPGFGGVCTVQKQGSRYPLVCIGI